MGQLLPVRAMAVRSTGKVTKALSKDKDTIDFEKWGVPEPVPVPEHIEDEKEPPKKVTFTRQARTRTLGRPVSRQWAI